MGMEHTTLAAPLSFCFMTVTPASMEDSLSVPTKGAMYIACNFNCVLCYALEKETMWQLLVIGINVLAIRY